MTRGEIVLAWCNKFSVASLGERAPRLRRAPPKGGAGHRARPGRPGHEGAGGLLQPMRCDVDCGAVARARCGRARHADDRCARCGRRGRRTVPGPDHGGQAAYGRDGPRARPARAGRAGVRKRTSAGGRSLPRDVWAPGVSPPMLCSRVGGKDGIGASGRGSGGTFHGPGYFGPATRGQARRRTVRDASTSTSVKQVACGVAWASRSAASGRRHRQGGRTAGHRPRPGPPSGRPRSAAVLEVYVHVRLSRP